MYAEGLETYFDIRGVNYEVPDAYDPTREYGQSWTYNKARKTVYDLALEVEANDHITVRAAVRYGDMLRKYRFVSAKLTDLRGNYTETFVDSPGNDEWATAAYALMDARFKTGDFKHNLTFGYTHWGFTFARGGNFVADMGPSYIHAPAKYRVPGRARGYDRSMDMRTHNIILGDRIVFTPEWSLLSGVNYAEIDTRFHGVYEGAARPAQTIHDAFTPTAGVVYKPISSVSICASYMQGLGRGGTAPASAANANEVLDANVSDQYEIGVKATALNSLDLTLALFRLDKANQYVDSDNVYKQDGRQVHQGLEFLISGKIIDGLTVTGGFTTMRAQVETAGNNPATEGEVPLNVPEQQARLYLEYRLPTPPEMPGFFTLSAGSNYYGRRPVNIPNTDHIPAVTTFDTGLRYQYKDSLTFNLNVSNVLNEHCWSYYRRGSDGAGEDGLLLGAPRLFSVSVKYKF